MTVTDGVASEEALVDWEGVQGGDELLFSIESERGEDENAGISADVCEWETLCDWQTFGTGKAMNNIYLCCIWRRPTPMTSRQEHSCQ